MENKYVKKTSIPGLLVLERPVFEDERGFFREIFHMDELEKEIGFKFKPVQMNHSRSLPSVLRGLHAEQWNKMIYPVTGTAFLAIVDLRPDFSLNIALLGTISIALSSASTFFVIKSSSSGVLPLQLMYNET